jgi:hypothetical protein
MQFLTSIWRVYNRVSSVTVGLRGCRLVTVSDVCRIWAWEGNVAFTTVSSVIVQYGDHVQLSVVGFT